MTDPTADTSAIEAAIVEVNAVVLELADLAAVQGDVAWACGLLRRCADMLRQLLADNARLTAALGEAEGERDRLRGPHIDSDSVNRLAPLKRQQAEAIARELLTKCGAYEGSPTDAVTDAVGILAAVDLEAEADAATGRAVGRRLAAGWRATGGFGPFPIGTINLPEGVVVDIDTAMLWLHERAFGCYDAELATPAEAAYLASLDDGEGPASTGEGAGDG